MGAYSLNHNALHVQRAQGPANPILEGIMFISLDESFIIYENVDLSTSRAARVACASVIKEKLDNRLGYIRKRVYEEIGEGFSHGVRFQR